MTTGVPSNCCDIQWHNDDHTVLQVTVYNSVTWEQFHQIAQHIHTLISQQEHIIDVLYVIATDSNPLPHGDLNLNLTNVHQYQPRNIGVRIVVNPPTLLKTVLQIYMMFVGKLNTHEIEFAQDLPEAFKVLQRSRERRSKRFALVQ